MSEQVIKTSSFDVNTKGENDIVNITERIQKEIRAMGVTSDAIALLFLQSTTSALGIIEYEDGLLVDFPRALERIAPKSEDYEHEKAWHDGNGHSHIRSTMIGTSLSIPVVSGKIALGQWQQIILTEFDVRPRKRTFVLQLVT